MSKNNKDFVPNSTKKVVCDTNLHIVDDALSLLSDLESVSSSYDVDLDNGAGDWKRPEQAYRSHRLEGSDSMFDEERLTETDSLKLSRTCRVPRLNQNERSNNATNDFLEDDDNTSIVVALAPLEEDDDKIAKSRSSARRNSIDSITKPNSSISMAA